MKFDTNKEKGNTGLALAIGYYGSNGYTVSLPLNDTQDYDLIVDKTNKLYRVQVKATAQRSPYGYTIVSLRSCGGTKGQQYKTVIDTKIELLFVVTELGELYEIPAEIIQTTTTLNLGPQMQRYRVDTVPTSYQNPIVSKEKPLLTEEEKREHFLQAMADRRTVERPTPEQLGKQIVDTSFAAVGRLYGVTDNAIRKWCKAYGMPTTKTEIKQWLESHS